MGFTLVSQLATLNDRERRNDRLADARYLWASCVENERFLAERNCSLVIKSVCVCLWAEGCDVIDRMTQPVPDGPVLIVAGYCSSYRRRCFWSCCQCLCRLLAKPRSYWLYTAHQLSRVWDVPFSPGPPAVGWQDTTDHCPAVSTDGYVSFTYIHVSSSLRCYVVN